MLASRPVGNINKVIINSSGGEHEQQVFKTEMLSHDDELLDRFLSSEPQQYVKRTTCEAKEETSTAINGQQRVTL